MSPNTTTATGGEAPSSTMSWWQQKRNKIFVSVTVMTLSIVLSVGIVVSSRGNKAAQQANPLEASGVTEFSTSNPRSLGFCNIVQELNAPQPDASSAKVAIDGKNLVVVSRGARQVGHDGYAGEGSRFNSSLYEHDKFDVYVEFYSLTDNGWKKVIGFQEEGIIDFMWEHGQRNIALSGKTAVITFPGIFGNGWADDMPIYTYRQSNSGSWRKVTAKFPEHGGVCLRDTVDVDNDLMVTFDDIYCGLCSVANKASIYKRTIGTWSEAGELTFPFINGPNVYQVALSGDTLALQVTSESYDLEDATECYIKIYQYNRVSGTIALQQDNVGSGCSLMVFDGNYLVHGLSVYHRQGIDDDQPFSLQKTFNSAEYGNGFGKSLALDNDILVVGSDDRTYMFSLRADAIAEVFSLDQEPDDTHEISDGMMVTSNQNEFGVTIVDCTQPIPARTSSPTEAPTPRFTASSTESTTGWSTFLGPDNWKTYAPTEAPTPHFAVSSTACLTEADCKDQMNGGYDQFVSGNYPYYGCFSKGGILYWGVGGTVEQMMDFSVFPPGGAKERVFC